METKLTKAGGDEMTTLISQAIDKKVPVETMEKLMSMRRELKAEWAKEQFDKAMSKFQGECPIIKKTRRVNFISQRTGKVTDYSFAPLEAIVEQIGDIISENGFSYTIQTKNKEAKITSTVCVRHIDGHQEMTDFEVPIDPDSFMNAQQKYASASTFAKRYAFCNAFGILTGDDDNDSNSIDPEPSKPVEGKKEAMMSDFQKDIRIYGSGAKLGKSKDQLDAYIMSHLDEDWPDYSKITISRANKIADALEKMVKDAVIEGEEVTE